MVCDGVPMADIPTELQDSRVFKLHLRGNGLHRFPDSKLEGTGKNIMNIFINIKNQYDVMSYTLVQKPYPKFGTFAFPYLERRTLHYTLMAINASQFLRKSKHVIFSFYNYYHGRFRPMYKDFVASRVCSNRTKNS